MLPNNLPFSISSWMCGSEVEIIHRLFYIFSSNSTGVHTLSKFGYFHLFGILHSIIFVFASTSLVARFHDLYPGFGIFFQKVCEDEPHLIPFEQYHNSLRALIPVIDVIVTNLPLVQAFITFDSGILFVDSIIQILNVYSVYIFYCYVFRCFNFVLPVQNCLGSLPTD